MTTREPETLVLPAAEGPVVSLDDVTKTYQTGAVAVQALRGVTLDVFRGEYVAIMGPSGSGRSTLMNILGCLDVLTTGRYLLNGHDVANLGENDLADIRNKEIGFVFQQFNLLPALSAWRNVELPLFYGGVAPAERRQRAVDALERVGLGSRIHHRPGELSGGQQQRVAVARALASEPAMILADEPTGNLDSASTDDVLSLFAELHETGRTVVLITHEHEVGARAQRMVHVRDGRITDAEVAA
ncbi:Putative ABC transporter ATP-binding protein [Acidipropionibacterium acidipropionici ATCC 4875]|uniref:ABC transporter ATP-binding protein n=1 Tax=Acidipropionibacterium acidipropionici (strain ATCC 4875 / DSM 20272 / JCM 6432 / NBRC 12425 / NCIMB 8070 / 4) TaxID=1171373 RepID=K7S0T5_ACIA4|nr:ABC transporter ATP-binding protein [Acidipropionibacterium acidipropionici]AFV88202.1 Putative ABC transporter ATP-binding protein [Acidipropionibacterium acidipropionici ATCC 4875]